MCIGKGALHHWSPTFLAPGTDFVEDSFSMGRRGGMVQAVMRAMERDGEWQMKLPSPAAHLLLCGLVPNRLRTGSGPRPRVWGPLLYIITHQGNVTMRHHHTPARMAEIRDWQYQVLPRMWNNIKCRQGYETTDALRYCWWECQVVSATLQNCQYVL